MYYWTSNGIVMSKGKASALKIEWLTTVSKSNDWVLSKNRIIDWFHIDDCTEIDYRMCRRAGE